MNTSAPDTQTILVAIDYSNLAALAVHQALASARQNKSADVHFVYAAASAELSEGERDAHRSELEQWISKNIKKDGALPTTVRVSAHVVEGPPAQGIVQLASDLSADVVFLGTHGRTGVARLVVGSVAEQVVRSCGCTVVIVRAKEHHNTSPGIEPACPQCVEARRVSNGERSWCSEHDDTHGKRHTYYRTRSESWTSHRIIS